MTTIYSVKCLENGEYIVKFASTSLGEAKRFMDSNGSDSKQLTESSIDLDGANSKIIEKRLKKTIISVKLSDCDKIMRIHREIYRCRMSWEAVLKVNELRETLEDCFKIPCAFD